MSKKQLQKVSLELNELINEMKWNYAKWGEVSILTMNETIARLRKINRIIKEIKK